MEKVDCYVNGEERNTEKKHLMEGTYNILAYEGSFPMYVFCLLTNEDFNFTYEEAFKVLIDLEQMILVCPSCFFLEGKKSP